MRNKQLVVIFELPPLQVFCFQTIEEWTRKAPPTEVFWRKKGENSVSGPFPTIYQAVNAYNAAQTDAVPVDVKKNVVLVDFVLKRRL